MSFLSDFAVRLLIAFVFTVINGIVIRELIVFFTKIQDHSVETPSIIAILMSLILLLTSYLSLIPYTSWLWAIIANFSFLYIFKRYYKIIEWQEAVEVWLYWFLFFVLVGAIVMLVLVLF